MFEARKRRIVLSYPGSMIGLYDDVALAAAESGTRVEINGIAEKVRNQGGSIKITDKASVVVTTRGGKTEIGGQIDRLGVIGVGSEVTAHQGVKEKLIVGPGAILRYRGELPVKKYISSNATVIPLVDLKKTPKNL